MNTAPFIPQIRIGHGFDVHRLVEGRRLMIGGIEVPHTTGALGHSDADVLIHAIADALLGAAALGDLGGFFPDTAAEYRDANSRDLLAICVAHVQTAGYLIGNVDSTVVVQAPRLAPFIAMMRQRLAETLGIDMQQISVKAKTSERLGYTGDGSGIAAYAVATLVRPTA